MLTLYWYPKCSTCKKAKKWLKDEEVDFQTVDMIKNVPTSEEITSWMANSELPLRSFFNTSGRRYRELELKEKVSDMTIADASQLLSTDGMLIKRPILVKDNQLVAIGFNETIYEGAAI